MDYPSSKLCRVPVSQFFNPPDQVEGLRPGLRPICSYSWRRCCVSRYTELQLGDRVNFCGKVCRVSSIQPQFYLLEDDACSARSIPKKLLDDQLASGTAFLHIEDQGAVFNLLQKAGPRELEQANHRLKILNEIKDGKPIEEVAKSHSISERTVRNWRRQFSLAEQELGEGFVGLIPKISSRGNRESRLDPATSSLIELTLEEHYLNKKSPPLSHAYGLFLHACEKREIPAVKRLQQRQENALGFEWSVCHGRCAH